MRTHRAAAALLCAGLASALAVTLTDGALARAGEHANRAAGQAAGVSVRGYDEPYAGFASVRRLREGRPADLGLRGEPIEAALTRLRALETEPGPSGAPLYPGSVALLGARGRIVARQASGEAVRYSDADGTLLPADRRVPARDDTIYDLASISKVFTSILVMQEAERGLDLDAPVAAYLPEFAAAGKERVTVRQLLTHTSGFEPFIPLWKLYPDKASRIAGVLAHPLKHPPGTRYVYSDLNLITLGVLLERRTGSPLDELLRERITAPLGMTDTGFNPDPSELARVAATEFDAALGRGVVRGEVHDENAASLGGVAGHAGVFATADDLAVLAQTLLNGGRYDGARILAPATVRAMLRNQSPEFPGDGHGLGVELDQTWYMGGLAGPHTAGHTGFTGTSMVIDPASRSFAILLTNRVHPTRTRGTINPARRILASGLADALPVTPRAGATALRAGGEDGVEATATLSVDVPASGARLSFATFIANDVDDRYVLERSDDDGATWRPLTTQLREPGRRLEVSGDLGSARGTRTWQRGTATLPPGAQLVRWRHTTDESVLGRGVYLDDIRVTTATGAELLAVERDPDSLEVSGWTPADH